MITEPAPQGQRLQPLIFLFLLSWTILLSGCDKPVEIQGFDKSAWKADRMACNGHRLGQETVIMEAREAFLGLSQEEIIDLMGKPERQELYSRGQKFYIYYLSPSSKCQEGQADVNTRFLYIRFSAINQVNEIFVQQK